MISGLKEKIIKNKKEIVLFLTFWIIYSLTITQNYSLSHDSTYYLNEIEYEGWYFHPHHLLFHIVFKLWNDFINFFHIFNDCNISYRVGVINALFGALNLSVLFSFLTKKIKFNFSLSYASVALIGFSWAYWYYSGCFEVYIIPLFFIILTIINSFEYLNGNQSITKSAIYLSIAVLFHQSNIFLIFPMLYIIYLKDRNSLISDAIRFLLIGLCIVVVPYLLAGILYYKNYTINSYWHWLTLYGNEIPYMWSKFGSKLILDDLVGFFRTFYSSYFLYSIASFQQLIYKAFPDKWLEEEIFLVRNMSTLMGITLLSLVGLAFINVSSIVVMNFKNIKSNYLQNRNLIKILLAFFITLSTFFTFWSSNNLEFWIPQNVIFWIVFILLFKNDSKVFLGSIVFLAISHLFVNFMAGPYYCVDKNNDYFYRKIKLIIVEKPENAFVLTPNPIVLNDYLTRYKVKNVFSIFKYYEKSTKEQVIDTLNRIFTNKSNNVVYATADLFKIEKNKYSKEFLDLINIYFSNPNFEIITRHENQPEEFYIIKNRN